MGGVMGSEGRLGMNGLDPMVGFNAQMAGGLQLNIGNAQQSMAQQGMGGRIGGPKDELGDDLLEMFLKDSLPDAADAGGF